MANKMKYLFCGKFFDGVNQVLREQVGILIEDDTIIAVAENLDCPENAEKIDLSNLTVTPGLIDSHVHYDFISPDEFSHVALNNSDEMKTLTIVHNCMNALKKGITTVRLTGTFCRGFGPIDARRAIEKGLFPGSRILAAPHAIGSIGGHWDCSVFHSNTNPLVSEFLTQPYGLSAGADGFKNQVRLQAKYGADFIKVMAAGGFASPGDDPGMPQLDEPECRAIFDTARGLGLRTVVHAYNSDVIDNMILWGADEIEHATMIKKHTVELMKEHGTFCVPTLRTLTPPDDDIDKNATPSEPPAFIRKLAYYNDLLKEGWQTIVQMIKDEEIVVGLGADICMLYPNSDGWREFKAWRDLGIPALRTLVAATSANAKIIDRNEIGIITPGKKADIAGWHRNILTDHYALSECSFVMKEGMVYPTN